MKFKLLFLVATVLSTLIACKKNSEDYVPTCGSTTPSFASSVNPLIQSRCSTSGCHNTATHAGGHDLTTYALISDHKTHIYDEVASGSMPEGSSLTSAQKDTILCWINAGAPNN